MAPTAPVSASPPAPPPQVAEIAGARESPVAACALAVERRRLFRLPVRLRHWRTPRPPTIWWSRPAAARVFLDPVRLDLLAGAELDWNEALIGAHFVVRNPQAVSGCGCGVSFAVA